MITFFSVVHIESEGRAAPLDPDLNRNVFFLIKIFLFFKDSTSDVKRNVTSGKQIKV